MTDSDINYIICPDNTCKLFWKDDGKPVACDGHCPHGDKMQMMIVCFKCKKETYFDPKVIGKWQRHDCTCGACTFIRSNGKYQLIFQS